jgi:phosphopantothenoylcysteine synthetase/decarboxylase
VSDSLRATGSSPRWLKLCQISLFDEYGPNSYDWLPYTGKRGFALADAARERGARVTLITTAPPHIQAAWWDCTMHVTNEPRSVAKETGT